MKGVMDSCCVIIDDHHRCHMGPHSCIYSGFFQFLSNRIFSSFLVLYRAHIKRLMNGTFWFKDWSWLFFSGFHCISNIKKILFSEKAIITQWNLLILFPNKRLPKLLLWNGFEEYFVFTPLFLSIQNIKSSILQSTSQIAKHLSHLILSIHSKSEKMVCISILCFAAFAAASLLSTQEKWADTDIKCCTGLNMERAADVAADLDLKKRGWVPAWQAAAEGAAGVLSDPDLSSARKKRRETYRKRLDIEPRVASDLGLPDIEKRSGNWECADGKLCWEFNFGISRQADRYAKHFLVQNCFVDVALVSTVFADVIW